jgi:cysteine desulfurase
VSEISKIAHEAGIYVHTDAVQAVGHIPVDVEHLGVDLLSMSAHKLYGPKGTGALYIRRGTSIESFIHGGGQEDGRRAGTENVPGIVGFGEAAKLAKRELTAEQARLTNERDRMIASIMTSIPKVALNGHPTQRLPNNVNISIDGVAGEALMLNLDLEGFCVSTGSACNTSSHAPSHVLLALGMPVEQAHSSLRMTLGHWTSPEDIDRCIKKLAEITFKLRQMTPIQREKRGENK